MKRISLDDCGKLMPNDYCVAKRRGDNQSETNVVAIAVIKAPSEQMLSLTLPLYRFEEVCGEYSIKEYPLDIQQIHIKGIKKFMRRNRNGKILCSD